MKTRLTDFNGADRLFAGSLTTPWQEVANCLAALPLHLKASDQEGKQGTPIFDPVGTNAGIKTCLTHAGWATNIPISADLDFLGTDVDFGKEGIVAEAQFSNYPFLINNLLRAELFRRNRTTLNGKPTEAAILITKGHMFPASNSTLYYEQAEKQLTALSKHHLFDVPLRLVGLFEAPSTTVSAVWTEYSEARYSRTVVKQTRRECRILTPKRAGDRCVLDLS